MLISFELVLIVLFFKKSKSYQNDCCVFYCLGHIKNMFTLSRPAEEKVSDLIYFKIYFPLNICATVKKTPSNFPTFWEVEKELSNNF